MKTRSVLSTLATLGLIAATAAPAHADVIRLSNFSHGYKAVNIAYNSGNPATSFTEYVAAGEFFGTLNGSAFATFCVDIFQEVNWNTSYGDYHLVDGAAKFGNAKATDLGRLVTGYGNLIGTGATADLQAATSAAFQLATWEIVSEAANTPYRLDSGAFKAWGGNAAGALALAQDWLDHLPTNSRYDVDVMVSATTQDMMVRNKVPEPGSLALAFAGLGLLGFQRRRMAGSR